MPTPSKRFMNFTATGFTPSGGSLATLTGVTNVQFSNGGNLVEFSGDGDRFPTTIVNDYNKPTVTVTLADLAAVRLIPPGTRGVFVTTHNDAKNLAVVGGGAIIYTMINAVCRENTAGGAHRQIGQGNLNFEGESADGITNPLSSAAA